MEGEGGTGKSHMCHFSSYFISRAESLGAFRPLEVEKFCVSCAWKGKETGYGNNFCHTPLSVIWNFGRFPRTMKGSGETDLERQS